MSTYGISGGEIRVTATHPFRVVQLVNRNVHGALNIDRGERPLLLLRVTLPSKGFKSFDSGIQAATEDILGIRQFPEISFTSNQGIVRAGRRTGESEIFFEGDLTVAGKTMKDVSFPLFCAVTPDVTQCRFFLNLALSELGLAPPKPLGLRFEDAVKVEGEWVATREVKP